MLAVEPEFVAVKPDDVFTLPETALWEVSNAVVDALQLSLRDACGDNLWSDSDRRRQVSCLARAFARSASNHTSCYQK